MITDNNAGKLKDKKNSFGIDESALIKLKAYKIIPKDSGKSNIMKIIFPRKQLAEKFSSIDSKQAGNKTSDPILSIIQNSNGQDLGKDFIEVDDILLVRDPKDLDEQMINELSDDVDSTTEYFHPIYMPTTEKIDIENLTLAERLRLASKQRMMNKMTKLELKLQRELFKREDTTSDKSKSANVDAGTSTDNVKKSVMEEKIGKQVTSETSVLAQSESSLATESSMGNTTEKLEESQPTEIPTGESSVVISATLSTKLDNEEPNVGAALPTSDTNAQDSSTENVKPNEEKVELTVSEADNTKSENEEATILGSTLQAPTEADSSKPTQIERKDFYYFILFLLEK